MTEICVTSIIESEGLFVALPSDSVSVGVLVSSIAVTYVPQLMRIVWSLSEGALVDLLVKGASLLKAAYPMPRGVDPHIYVRLGPTEFTIENAVKMRADQMTVFKSKHSLPTDVEICNVVIVPSSSSAEAATAAVQPGASCWNYNDNVVVGDWISSADAVDRVTTVAVAGGGGGGGNTAADCTPQQMQRLQLQQVPSNRRGGGGAPRYAHRRSPGPLTGAAALHRRSPGPLTGAAALHRRSPGPLTGAAALHRRSPGPLVGGAALLDCTAGGGLKAALAPRERRSAANWESMGESIVACGRIRLRMDRKFYTKTTEREWERQTLRSSTSAPSTAPDSSSSSSPSSGDVCPPRETPTSPPVYGVDAREISVEAHSLAIAVSTSTDFQRLRRTLEEVVKAVIPDIMYPESLNSLLKACST
eukprot:GHVU01061863.1.p1 GENE.GHVU01061863.1~~GHVU01061863.1.p1  ORF type:complete len:418 (+),score=69.25 GHVU01061863.1:125-1378(+)